ncbi:hypothetical protein [Magnetospirillum sp. 64-120]|uniref:hypothetical protein n=1 Tax=Magnetospirillum sp. 64-120 TaxID=1895778 RepID=UPI00092A36CE|nr:hypothetical protein [Magnetospirillum sp. 64-120]OJX70550.1 MAG: hypothetical protein BGO92_18440 [Magnetospirillum sp. 64-120]
MSTPPEDPRAKFTRPLQRPGADGAARPALSPRPGRPNLPAVLEHQPAAAPEEAPHVQAGGLARLLEAVAKMLQPKPANKEAAEAQPAPRSEPAVLSVVVAAMNGDNADGAASQQIYKALDLRQTLKVKPLPRPFVLENPLDPAQVAALVTNTRHMVADENADLLVWGDVSKDGYVLRFATANIPDEEKPAQFGPHFKVELPLNLGEAQLHMLYAATLAAAEPANEMQRAALRRLLPQAVEPLELLAAKPPVSLSMGQQRSILLTFAQVCTATALLVPPSQSDAWFDKAANAYLGAEKRLGRNEAAHEVALIHKHLAASLTARAERVKDKAQTHLEQAVKYWREAASHLTRATLPLEWAAAQTRLGVALHRLDLITGDSELLREALGCLQAALQVHTKAEAPGRWADIMNSIAQVLEVYGDQLKNPEVLQRAVDACNLVLEVRSRDRAPLAWAATLNTLGSALFLLDRHGGGTTHLAEAARVFEDAAEVFTAHGAKGPAQVAARNLAHVRKLAEERKGRAVIDPDWR